MSFWTSKGSCNEHRCHKLGSLACRWAIHLSEQVQCEYARRLDGGAQTFKTGTTNFSIDLHWRDAAGDPLNSSLADSSSEVHKWHSKARESCLSSQRFRNTIIIFAAFCCSVGEEMLSTELQQIRGLWGRDWSSFYYSILKCENMHTAIWSSVWKSYSYVSPNKSQGIFKLL